MKHKNIIQSERKPQHFVMYLEASKVQPRLTPTGLSTRCSLTQIRQSGRDVSSKMIICGYLAMVGMGIRHDQSSPKCSPWLHNLALLDPQPTDTFHGFSISKIQEAKEPREQLFENFLWCIQRPALLLPWAQLAKFHLKFDLPLPENPKLCPKVKVVHPPRVH